MKRPLLLVAGVVILSLTSNLEAGGVVVSNDEVLFSDRWLSSTGGAQFATNIAKFLTGGSGSILIDSNNFGLQGTDLFNLLTGLGYSVTETTTTPASFSGYAAVFVGGMAVDNTELTNYVNGGGSVLLLAGTGTIGSGAADEAAAWNPFLHAFGLGLATSYNGIAGDINVSAFQTLMPYGAPLFGGVSDLFVDNGNNVLSVGANPNAQVFNDSSGNGLYGAMVANGIDISVNAMMDIYRAGGYKDHSDGVAPAVYRIQPGTVQTVTFSSISGMWTCSSIGPIVPSYGPDGVTTGGCNNGTGRHINNPIGPLSGYDSTDFSGALAGVFLADSLPTSAPPPLRFYVSDASKGGIQTNFASLSPQIGQVFFIGDGLTGTGSGAAQMFQVPPTASHLYLGYVDSCNATVPSCYGDNAGSIAVTIAASCGFSISPTNQSFGASGGSNQIVVTTLLPPASCGFSATPNANWIVPSEAGSVHYPPLLSYSVAPNTEPTPRTGTLTVADETLTITQSGTGACTYSISPTGQTFGANGANGTVKVSTQAGCSWSAISNIGWVTISPGSLSGSGNGTVSFAVAANSGAPRTGTLTVANQTYTVTESAPACGAIDVSNKISVFREAVVPDPPFDYYVETIVLHNASAQTIPGPIYLVMDGLPRTGSPCVEVGVSNPTCNVYPTPPVTFCQSTNGSALVMFSSSSMTPGQTITISPTFLPGWSAGGVASGFAYTTRLFSGTPNQ